MSITVNLTDAFLRNPDALISTQSLPVSNLTNSTVTLSKTLSDEPIGQIATIFILLLTLLTFGMGSIALIYANYHRNYPPLKAKHIPFLTVAFIGSFLWYLGELHSNGVFGYSNALTELCTIIDVWIQFVFGVELFLAVLVLRLYSLYQVFVRHRAISDVKLMPPIIAFYLPVLAIALYATFAPIGWAFYYDFGNAYCSANFYFKLSLFIVGAIGLLVLGWLTFKLRDIRRGFNEFKELRIGFYFALLTIIVNTLVVLLDWNYHVWGKYLLVIVNLFMGNVYFWLVMYRPLYGCMFEREKCLQKFITDLNLEGIGYKGASIENSQVPLFSRRPTQAAVETEVKKIGSPRMRTTAYRFAAQAGGGTLIPINRKRFSNEEEEEDEMESVPNSGIRRPPVATTRTHHRTSDYEQIRDSSVW